MKDMVSPPQRITCRFILLSCFISSVVILYLIAMDLIKDDSQLIDDRPKYARFSLNNSSSTSESQAITTVPSSSITSPSISLFVRMAARLEKHRYRYYCDLLRTTVLYWPPSYGKTVVVLDEESEVDHVFAQNITRLNREHFPDYKLEVLFEPLPKDNNVLAFPGMPKPPGYNRQLWSSFFIDLYTNDSIVGWVDGDVAFVTPVTKSSIFDGPKLRVIGWDCSRPDPWVESWARTTEEALGLPYVADFVGPFPIYIYRDTFTNCREHILKRFNTTNFEEVFKKFYQGKGEVCPVSTVVSYAWYFERNRYDWNLKICSDLTEYNKRFPDGHKIGPEHMEWVLSEPQTTFHVPYGEFLIANILTSYCLSHEAAGNKLDICANRQFSLSDNFVLLHHNLERISPKNRHRVILPKPCEGEISSFCLKVLERHYKQVGLELKQNARKLDWGDLKTVEKLAGDFDIKCKPIES